MADSAKREWREWASLIVEVVALAVVIWYAYTAYQQRNEMIQANTLTRRALEQARTSAEVAAEANRISQRGLEASQRAWVVFVGYEPLRFDLSPNETAITVVLKNVGTSPGIRVATKASWLTSVGGFPTPPPFKITTSGSRSVGVMAPGTPYLLYVKIPRPSAPILQSINDGTAKLYVYGSVEYLDQFNRSRRTTFCQVYYPHPPLDRSLGYCDAYNEIDESRRRRSRNPGNHSPLHASSNSTFDRTAGSHSLARGRST